MEAGSQRGCISHGHAGRGGPTALWAGEAGEVARGLVFSQDSTEASGPEREAAAEVKRLAVKGRLPARRLADSGGDRNHERDLSPGGQGRSESSRWVIRGLAWRGQ